jgi:hypothetical protein
MKKMDRNRRKIETGAITMISFDFLSNGEIYNRWIAKELQIHGMARN